jgi:uncharacterized protein YggE
MRSLFLLFALVLPSAVRAQPARDGTISVNTTRTIHLAPDRASWFLSIEGTDASASTALALAESKLATVTLALRRLGAGVELGAPVPFAVGPTPAVFGSRGTRPDSGTVTARTALRVRVTRIGQLGKALAAGADAGATSASAVMFESAAVDSALEAALGAALASARLQAQGIARSLDGFVGELIDVNTSNSDRGFSQATLLPYAGAVTQLYAPEVTVNVTVAARFRLIRDAP